MPQTANTTLPSSTTPHAASGSVRSRPQAGRKKANLIADDAAYHGASNTSVSIGAKRTAVEKADGEPRLKRKRVDTGVGGNIAGSSSAGVNAASRRAADKAVESSEGKVYMIQFDSLPTGALHRYLQEFDLIPEVNPSPLTAHDPPPPSSLLHPRGHRHSASASPAPPPLPITPANRPRREPSASVNRRRSSRLLEEEPSPSVVPVLADVGEIHGMLAAIAQKHFREHSVKEVDTLTQFMCAVKAKVMKFTALSSLAVILPLLAQQVSATPLGFGSGVAVGSNAAPAPAKTTNKAAASSAPAKAASSAAAASSASAAAPAASSSAANSGDLQSSLTLDPSVIATGFENDGQDVPTAGQVASLTSSNNFINFCATVPNLVITNGQQVKAGSCNPAPMGVIAATTNMPSSKFQFPANGATIKSNTAFTVNMAISHLETGFFVNANENYFAAPQFVNSAGDIQGHSHVVIELLSALDQTTATDPTHFAFFKGLNDKASNGVLSADVTSGLPAGAYRIASINSAANHQPVLVAIAQHGTLDDMVYFTVTDSGNAASNSSSTAPPAASSVAASSVASSAAASTATVAIKGANTGGKPGVQGGFAQKGNNNQQKGNTGNKNASPQGGFRGGFGGGFKLKRNALNRATL